MIDAGLRLDPGRDVVATMAGQRPSDWSAHSLASIKGNRMAGKSGIPLKYVYGPKCPTGRRTETLAVCVDKALASLERLGVRGEVLS